MLKLIPPGQRGNKFWAVRGTIDGHEIERSLGTSIRTVAETKLIALLREYEAGKTISDNVTFEMAAERYIAFRKPTEKYIRCIDKLKKELGHYLCSEITHSHLVDAINRAYPNFAPQSKNSSGMTPACTILHYAAENQWCSYKKFKPYKQPKPKTRYVTDEVEDALLSNTTGIKYLFLLWLFRQGDRLNDVLQMRFEHCDLEKRIVYRYISKSDRETYLDLDPEICQILKLACQKEGFIFPWRYNMLVYGWLRPLCQRLGVEFTPHRARHTLGKRLNDTGAGLRTIMLILGQVSPNSAIRYQTTDLETIRRAKEKANG